MIPTLTRRSFIATTALTAASLGLSAALGHLAWRIAGGAADDLHHFGQAGAIADSQGVFAPDPVEAFLRHAQRDDDVC